MATFAGEQSLLLTSKHYTIMESIHEIHGYSLVTNEF